MVKTSFVLFCVTQAWFVAAYLIGFVISFATSHLWRFLAATITSFSTILALAFSGTNFHTSIASPPFSLSFIGIELPYGLENFPITIAFGFAAILYFCDALGHELFCKKLFKKALISSLFCVFAVVLNMTMFMIYGHMVIGIPYLKWLFLTVCIVATVAQFFFTFLLSVLDIIFYRFPKLRVLYIVLFLLLPVVYTFLAFKFYVSGGLVNFVANLKEWIEPVTFVHVGYVGVFFLFLFIVWYGKAAVEAFYTPNAIMFFMSFVLLVMFPASLLFLTATQRGFHCHRDLKKIFSDGSGIVYAVMVTAASVVLLSLPMIYGKFSDRNSEGSNEKDEDDVDDEEEEEEKVVVDKRSKTQKSNSKKSGNRKLKAE